MIGVPLLQVLLLRHHPSASSALPLELSPPRAPTAATIVAALVQHSCCFLSSRFEAVQDREDCTHCRCSIARQKVWKGTKFRNPFIDHHQSAYNASMSSKKRSKVDSILDDVKTRSFYRRTRQNTVWSHFS